MLNASADVLDHLGLDQHATLLQDALYKTVNIERVHTPGKWRLGLADMWLGWLQLFPFSKDLRGQATTMDVVQSVIRNIQEETKVKNW